MESLVAHPAVKRINFTGSTRVGRIIAEMAGRHLKRTLLELGGKAPLVVLDHVTPKMKIYHEESFGPVVCVVRVRGMEEAIRVANDTEYGLSAAVFGRDVTRTVQVAKRIQSGMCHINGPTVQDEAQMPFGGVKASGYGRFGGKAAIDEFTDLRWITIEDSGQPYPF